LAPAVYIGVRIVVVARSDRWPVSWGSMPWANKLRARSTRELNGDPIDSLGVTTDEVFWNICFSNIFGPACVGGVVMSLNFQFGAVYFMSFYSVMTQANRYSCSYNDVDGIHVLAWCVYGIFVMGMFANAMPDRDHLEAFAFSIALAKLTLSTLWMRVAYYMPSEPYAHIACWTLVSNAVLWMAVGTFGEIHLSDSWPRAIFLIPALDPMFFIDLLYPDDMPKSTDFLVAKTTSINVLMLGVLMMHAVLGLKVPTRIPDTELRSHALVLCSTIFVLVTRVLMQRADAVPRNLHAVRSGHFRFRAWIGLQGFLIASVVSCGAGICRMIKLSATHVGGWHDDAGQQLAGLGAAGLMTVIMLIDMSHNRPVPPVRTATYVLGAVTSAGVPWLGMWNLNLCVSLCAIPAIALIIFTSTSHPAGDVGTPAERLAREVELESASEPAGLANGAHKANGAMP